MKFFIVLCLVAVVFAASDDDIKKWKAFKVKHGKMFMSKNKEDVRMNNFLKHHATVENINEKFAKGESMYTAAVYSHHDLSHDEFHARFCGRKADNITNARIAPMMRQTPLGSLDLSTTAEVGPVKSQGQCGSCWTFATTACTESRSYRNTGNAIVLSEQQLVECVYPRTGCDGGYTPTGYEWVKANGQTTSANIPYTGGYSGVCTKPSADFVAKGWVQYNYDVNTIKNALNTNGVLGVDVDATYWSPYQKGLFTVPTAQYTSANHAVALVGYGTDGPTGLEYWKIRNSWGTGWGENGYIRIPIYAPVGQENTHDKPFTFSVL